MSNPPSNSKIWREFIKSGKWLKTPLGLGVVIVIAICVVSVVGYFVLMGLGLIVKDFLIPEACNTSSKLWAGCPLLGIVVVVILTGVAGAAVIILTVVFFLALCISLCYEGSHKVWEEHKKEMTLDKGYGTL